MDGDYKDPATFQAIHKALNGSSRPTHYLAIPPALFETVVAQLAKAEEVLEGARNKLATGRTEILERLAQASANNGWSADVISDAVTKAVDAWKAASNDAKTAATISQFALECKKVMHPAARDNVAKAFAIAKRAWEEERSEVADTDEGEAVETPLINRFKKRYHMGLRMVDAMLPKRGKKGAETANPLASVALDPHALAEALDQEGGSAKRIASRIKRLREELAAIAAEFPVAEIEAAIDELEGISADRLEAAAQRMAAQAAREARKAQRAAPKPEPEADEDEDEPAPKKPLAPKADENGVANAAKAAARAAKAARAKRAAKPADDADIAEAADELLDE